MLLQMSTSEIIAARAAASELRVNAMAADAYAKFRNDNAVPEIHIGGSFPYPKVRALLA